MRAKVRQHMVMRGGVAVPLTPVSERACLGKVQHRTWDDADEARYRLQAQQRKQGDRWPLDVYCCKFCHYWHVGHARQQRKRVA